MKSEPPGSHSARRRKHRTRTTAAATRVLVGTAEVQQRSEGQTRGAEDTRNEDCDVEDELNEERHKVKELTAWPRCEKQD